MNIILFDEESTWRNLLPLSFTRPLSLLRVGISTIAEKWEQVVEGHFSYMTAGYLSEKYPLHLDADGDNLFIAGNVIPERSVEMSEALAGLVHGQALVDAAGRLVAFRGSEDALKSRGFVETVEFPRELKAVVNLYDIFMLNGEVLCADFACVRGKSLPLSATNTLIGPEVDENGRPLVFIAPGAKVEGSYINTTHGPVYVGPDAEVMEGCCLRGPVAICRHATVNMGTKIYPNTTIGPWCKVGGELNNIVMIGFSNKAHDGFLGNAVVGEWCNLGADTVASNLKNDYSKVRVWNYLTQSFERTDLQFCGLIMADHSKAGINTMFNTATVVGVGTNIHGAGFPRTYIPSFSIGGAAGFNELPMKKFFDTAERVMARRGKTLTEVDRRIFETIRAFGETDVIF